MLVAEQADSLALAGVKSKGLAEARNATKGVGALLTVVADNPGSCRGVKAGRHHGASTNRMLTRTVSVSSPGWIDDSEEDAALAAPMMTMGPCT